MHVDQESLRLIFGLKLRTLRKDKGLSLKSLAQSTGLSASYINEIEKGKKYPRGEKILALADALETDYDDLISLKMKEELQSLSDILGSNLITGLPFDVFGIETRSLFELISQSPKKSGALMATVLELTRQHNIGVESVFRATLRAFLDMHDNYFDELEGSAAEFSKTMKSHFSNVHRPSKQELKDFLKAEYSAEVVETSFEDHPAALRKLDYYVKQNGKRYTLHLNAATSERKKISLLAQEAGYRFLNLKERRPSPLETHLDSYQQLHNDFCTNYFAAALLYPSKTFVPELKNFASQKAFSESEFAKWMSSYPGSYTMFFERLTQCLPRHLNVDQLFLLRLVKDKKKRSYSIDRELHLSSLHSPHRVSGDQHYCRRWLSCSLFDRVKSPQTPIVATQISNFTGTDNRYFVLSSAWNQDNDLTQQSCITLGVYLGDRSKKALKFANPEKHSSQTVCSTCEQCPIEDCQERAANNTIYQRTHQESEVSRFIGSN